MEAAEKLYEYLNEEAEYEHELIEAIEKQQGTEKPRFVIETTEQAIWALRKIARIEKERQEAREAAQLEKARIEEWLAAEEKRCDQARAHLDFLLEEWHRKIIAENPKRKTIKLPHGTLELRKQPDEWAIDEEVLVPWLM
ncbi:MAG: host-nuclease inhibitor Gam family protein, partial [Firmicutes bacterium]|nr:host-nuclease inhibitor Gam family protein [Bacillota bacterium]